MFQKIELRKTRDFSAKINITFEFLRQNFKILAKAIIYMCGPFILIEGIFMGRYQQKVLSIGPATDGMIFSWLEQIFLSLGGAVFFGMLAYIIAVIAVNEFVKLYEIREDPTSIELSDLWDAVKRDFLKVVGAMVVVFFFTMVASIFLIIPGIYVGVCLSLVPPVLLIEGNGIGDAVSRCFKLINEKWWSTFGLLVITSIIAGFMGIVFQIPQYVFSFMAALHKASSDMSDPPMWQQVGTMLSSVIAVIGSNLLQTIVMVAIIFQFYNLVERRESRGLMNKMESFGKPDASAPRTDETY